MDGCLKRPRKSVSESIELRLYTKVAEKRALSVLNFTEQTNLSKELEIKTLELSTYGGHLLNKGA